MRILHISAYAPDEIGGLMIFVKNLISYQKNKGIYCEVLTTNLNKPINYSETIDGIKINYVKNFGEMWGKNPIFNVIPFLHKYSKKFDLIHVHSYIHFSSILAVFYAKLMKIPVILTLHGGIQTPFSIATSFTDYMQILFKKLFFDYTIGHLMMKLPDALISVSKSDLLSLPKYFSVSRKKNCFWVPNAVKLIFSNTLKGKNHNIERKYITYISPRLTYIKGFDLFLKIMENVNSRIPSIPIFIVGKGELSSLLDEYKKKLNITHINNLKHEKLSEVYLKSLIFICTSRFEGLPTVILEAMACETPIISTNVGGIPDLIEDNYNGFLYEPLDLDKATDRICHLIEHPEIQEFFAKRSKERINEIFSWKKVGSQNTQIYKKILNEKYNKS